MRISEVAQQLNLNPQTIYFYERIGLIPSPKRNSVGYRTFDASDLDRLILIERAKTLGLTLDEIKEVLQLKEGQSLTCAVIHQHLSQKLEDIDIKIAQLQALRSELLPLVQRCELQLSQDENPTDCGIFHRD